MRAVLLGSNVNVGRGVRVAVGITVRVGGWVVVDALISVGEEGAVNVEVCTEVILSAAEAMSGGVIVLVAF